MLLKKKENSEFLEEACALLREYCAKIKKKKKEEKNCISMGQYYSSKNCYKDRAAV